MSNILLLDGNDMACCAMKGILARGQHRLIVATSSSQAWNLLHELVLIDLVIVELKLEGEHGMLFVQRLRNDCLLQSIPVVVYTGVSDHAVISRALSLKLQNYLVKPYIEETIYAEIAKAAANPWRQLHFEEEKSFCAQLGLRPEDLRQQREELLRAVDEALLTYPTFAENKNYKDAMSRISALSEQAEACGYWGLVDYLKILRGKIEESAWDDFKQIKPDLEFARGLLFYHVHPTQIPEGFLTCEEREAQHEQKDREHWVHADVILQGPMVQAKEVEQQLDRLPGCPVIDTTAAAFVMLATGQGSNLNQLVDLTAKDPGLTAQVLSAANRLDRDDLSAIEDPRAAITLLGDIRLGHLARALPTVPERHLNFPPMSWPQFWQFQVGVARVAQFACNLMEFRELLGQAHTAGLLHDLGKLLLLKAYPFAFEAIIRHARINSVPLPMAERRFIGQTTREMAEYFARKHHLPPIYCHVIQWVETPEKAAEDEVLVSVVALARHLCQRNHLGWNGEPHPDQYPPFEEIPAWRILHGRMFLGFNLRKFEAQAHAFCEELKHELLGRPK